MRTAKKLEEKDLNEFVSKLYKPQMMVFQVRDKVYKKTSGGVFYERGKFGWEIVKDRTDIDELMGEGKVVAFVGNEN
jgi:hypothetical protein